MKIKVKHLGQKANIKVTTAREDYQNGILGEQALDPGEKSYEEVWPANTCNFVRVNGKLKFVHAGNCTCDWFEDRAMEGSPLW